MPKEKNIYGRISQKIDTEANWLKAINFIPNKGEIIIYEKDTSYSYDRIKIGDGVSNVNDLPFFNELFQVDWNQTDENAKDFILNKPVPITNEEIDAICGFDMNKMSLDQATIDNLVLM